MNGRGLAGLALLVSVCIASVAQAAPPEVCFTAHEKTQAERRDYHYLEAREQALACAQATCPKLIRDDCSQWYDELDQRVPSVVFAVRDAKGGDLVDVRVRANTTLLTDNIDGRAISLDPGVYKLRFEADGYRRVTRDVTIRESEKGRVIEVELESTKAAAASAPVAVREEATQRETHVAPATTEAHRERAFTPAVWTLGAVAVVGAAGLIGFGIAGENQKTDLESCAPDCDRKDTDAVKTKFILANASLGVGAAALVTATVLYFVGREVPTSSRARLGGTLLRQGGLLTLESSF